MQKTTSFIQHPVSKDHLLHIGDMTVSFALLEAEIQSLVWILIAEGQRIGQIVTAELSFRSLRALVISLYLERYGEDSNYSTLKGFMDKAATLESRRNQITHSIWGVGNDPQSITRMKASAKEKHGFQFQVEDIQVQGLSDFVSEIKQLVADVQFFWIDLSKDEKAVNN
ncbi:MAG: hypothetical protein ABSD46_12000 [Bacteroidota bacterium]